jgi:hypothetical protein
LNLPVIPIEKFDAVRIGDNKSRKFRNAITSNGLICRTDCGMFLNDALLIFPGGKAYANTDPMMIVNR